MHTSNYSRLLVGAEIMDDPTATPEKIDHWFKLLAEHEMPLARVFIPRSESDLPRMDWFFQAAEKHGVGISATLGGWPAPETAAWIQAVVLRYKDSPALDSWILINEPGQAPEANPLSLGRFRAWLKRKYGSVEAFNRVWNKEIADFNEVEFEPGWMGGTMWSHPPTLLDWFTFWREHLTWRLEWIAGEIRKLDNLHPTHVNPHALVGNLASMSNDLPSWHSFLDTYGASCHPSWHFTVLERSQYALGVAYINDLIQGAARGKPFWVTELQGGNNTNSGNRPLYPTPADIAQWLWTSFGSGAERIIFWLLNNRSYAGESGEWSLLDFQDQPSERLETAARVARMLSAQADFFDHAQPVETPITILLSLETMTLQERFERTMPVASTERGQSVRLEGRGRNAHLLSALAAYETFHELGIPVTIRHMHDYEWDAPGTSPRLAILPNVAALSAQQARDVEAFVRGGGTALITGLTGCWDPDNRFWPLADRFPLEDLLGATLKDLRTVEEGAVLHLQEPKLDLPVHLWMGEIRNHTAEIIGSQDGWISAVRKQLGRGTAIWMPSLVELGAWLGDNRPLAGVLEALARPFTHELPFRFAEQAPGCLLRVLKSENAYVTVISNGTLNEKRLRLLVPDPITPTHLWAEGSRLSDHNEVILPPRGTLVTRWQ